MSRPRKYLVNESIFENIDSHEKAYWLGFIQADGNVYKNTLTIELHPQDILQLNNFIKFLDSNIQITTRINNFNREYYSIKVNSSKIVKDLNRHGIIGNKTYIHSNILDLMPEEYIFDFYRGLIDGDGWIISHANNYNKKPTFELGLCSTDKNIIIKFKNLCNNNGSINGKKNNTAWQFIISGNNKFQEIVKLLGYNQYYSMPRKLQKINDALLYLSNRIDGRTTRHKRKLS